MVRTNTIVGPGCDSAVIYIKGTNKALAMKTDCNARYVFLNPREGAKIAVAESARNIVCSGGIPLAITNCLNFGNPYKPEVYWQFAEAIAGMGEACRFFDTPVTGGNVSFYNESPETAVYPTPTIGMVGLVEDLNHITTSYFKSEGDLIYLLGEDYEELGGSEFLKVIRDKVAGDSPKINLEVEKKLQNSLLHLIRKGLINSAHDISEGGIASALAECCIINQENMIGCEVEIPVKSKKDFSLFSESQSRIIVSITPGIQNRFESELNSLTQSFKLLGYVKGYSLSVKNFFEIELSKLSEIYYKTIPRIMGSEE
jgi:phosphoribosylformylglycinamidine synthase